MIVPEIDSRSRAHGNEPVSAMVKIKTAKLRETNVLHMKDKETTMVDGHLASQMS